MTTAQHLEAALDALRQKPPAAQAALDALEHTIRVPREWPDDKLAGARGAAANWARRAILRGGADLFPVIKAIEAALA